jgi:hypothetical protein
MFMVVEMVFAGHEPNPGTSPISTVVKQRLIIPNTET